MAKWHATWLALGLALAGCQSTGTPVSSIPSPNFGGPTMAERTPPVMQPLPAPAPVKPAPVAKLTGPREWQPAAGVPNRPWRYIVIHHSATTTGGAAAFDKMHRLQNHWDELGYHFVVGNGTESANGQVEVGPRWPKQKWGAHAKTADNRFNDYGIGICLVGNFDEGRPSAEQLKSVSRLVAYLMKTYQIPASSVIGHRDTKATECPGKYMNIATIRRLSTQVLADAGEAVEVDTRTAAAELMTETTPQ